MNYKSMIIVANTGDNYISVIDPLAWKEIDRIQFPANSGPYSLAKTNQHHSVLVTQSYSDALAYIDLVGMELKGNVIIGRRPSHIAYDEKRNLSFVTNSDSDTVSLVSVDRMKLMGQIGVGSMPQGLDFDGGSGDLAVANFNTGDLTIINTFDCSTKRVIKLIQNPSQVKYSIKGQRIYITCINASNGEKGSIFIIDAKNYSHLGQISLKGLPGQLYITNDEKYALVASLGVGGLDIIDLHRGKSLGNIRTNGMTQGITLDPQEKYVYVTNPYNNTISAVDWKSGMKVATLGVGNEPNGILFI